MKNNVVTIQKTSKRWKMVSICSVLTLIVAFVLYSMAQGNENLGLLSVLLGFLGVVGLIVAKVGAWWSNG